MGINQMGGPKPEDNGTPEIPNIEGGLTGDDINDIMNKMIDKVEDPAAKEMLKSVIGRAQEKTGNGLTDVIKKTARACGTYEVIERAQQRGEHAPQEIRDAYREAIDALSALDANKRGYAFGTLVVAVVQAQLKIDKLTGNERG